jgi:predicted membrane-bound spermidine synthase
MVLFENNSVFKEFRSKKQIISFHKNEDGATILKLNGDWQFNSHTEYVYHESMIHPAMAVSDSKKVFIAGGGDGLGVREVLKWPTEHIELCEIDEHMIHLFSNAEELVTLNQGALRDKRVTIKTQDAMERIAALEPKSVDVLVMDYPSPPHDIGNNMIISRLYSKEQIAQAARAVSDMGTVVIMGSITDVRQVEVIGTLLDMGYYVWRIDPHYTSGTYDTFLFARRFWPNGFNPLPQNLKYMTSQKLDLVFSKTTQITQDHLDYAAEFYIVLDDE